MTVGRVQGRPQSFQKKMGTENYTVKAGDTLTKIANRAYGVKNGALNRCVLILTFVNDSISNSDKLEIGQKIFLPSKNEFNNLVKTHFSEHSIKSGETLWSIAQELKDKGLNGPRYNNTQEIVDSLRYLNDEPTFDEIKLKPGQKIFVPIPLSSKINISGSAPSVAPGTKPLTSNDLNIQLLKPKPQTDETREYHVVAGDTLNEIALKTGINVDIIKAMNPALRENPDDLKINQTILIPVISIEILKGDNLTKIAARAGISLDVLLLFNPSLILNPNDIKVGEFLALPSSAERNVLAKQNIRDEVVQIRKHLRATPQVKPKYNTTFNIENSQKNEKNLYQDQNLRRLITGNESLRLTPYPDPVKGSKAWTVGYGTNLTTSNSRRLLATWGITPSELIRGTKKIDAAQAKALFENDLKDAVEEAKSLVRNFDQLDYRAKLVLVDMVYNMGSPKVRKFSGMRGALDRATRDPSYYIFAALEMRYKNPPNTPNKLKTLKSSDKYAETLWYKQTKSRADLLIGIIMDCCEPNQTKPNIYKNEGIFASSVIKEITKS